MGEINNVEKNGVNSFHNYKYAMEQDMLVAVRKKLSDANIFVFTGVQSVEIQSLPKEGFLTTIKTVHTFVDGETGEQIETTCAGQGTDKGDKGIYKAITGATKYFISKNFLIPTGDDPESFDEKRESAGRAPKQAVHNPVAQSIPQAPKQAQPAQKPEINPNLPPNPWVGKLCGISAPTTGINPKTKAAWSKWEIETKGHNGKPFNLSIFSSSIAEVAASAVSDDLAVEIIWKTKLDANGKEWNTVDNISHIKTQGA
jgi:hypothetical protein